MGKLVNLDVMLLEATHSAVYNHRPDHKYIDLMPA